jgi:ribosome-binding protein aMBF1 (putative translation factor)
MKRKLKRISLNKVLADQLKDSEFKFYFQREQAVSQIAAIVKKARLRAGLTQAQLAELIGTSQTIIGRLESGNDLRIPSLDLLQRIAQALHARLLVTFDFGKAA